MNTKLCLVCGTEFPKAKVTSKKVWEKQKYCSWKCRAIAVGKNKLGKKLSEAHREKIVIWYKDHSGENHPNYGKKPSSKTIEKWKSSNKGINSNEKNPSWKGDNAGYLAIHCWLNRHFPRKGICESCGKENCYTQYANIIDHQYTRNRKDYKELCVSCHSNLDERKRDSVTGRFMPMSV